jgi:outer membrane protein W
MSSQFSWLGKRRNFLIRQGFNQGRGKGIRMPSMRRKMFLFGAILLLGGVSNARAQGRFEITPFGGSRFGGVIDLNSSNAGTIDYFTIKSSVDYGVTVGYFLFPNLQAEFMWNRQPTELGAHDFVLGTTTDIGSATLDMFQWSMLLEFRNPREKLKPYVVGGIGFTHFGTNGAVYFSDKFSYNIGGGVKYYFSRHVGLRLDVRYSPSQTTSSLGNYCGPFGCFAATVPNYAHQGQANLGLILRF